MGRLIQLAVLVALAVLLYRYVRKSLMESRPDRMKKRSKIESLVQCRDCGVRLPESDAVKKGDHFYCPAHSKKPE